MARIEYTAFMKAIRGRIGSVDYTTWKGIPCARLRPFKGFYPFDSPLNAKQREQTSRLVKAWRDNLTVEERQKFQEYADYLATLTTEYKMLPGRKYPQGIMSAYNAFTLVNQLAFSVGFTAIITAPYQGEEFPIAPTLIKVSAGLGPPPKVLVEHSYGAVPTVTTFCRMWLRGIRYGHLFIAATQDVTDNTDFNIFEIRSTHGALIPPPPDTYQVQLDAVNEYGNFSPPSEIGTVKME